MTPYPIFSQTAVPPEIWSGVFHQSRVRVSSAVQVPQGVDFGSASSRQVTVTSVQGGDRPSIVEFYHQT